MRYQPELLTPGRQSVVTPRNLGPRRALRCHRFQIDELLVGHAAIAHDFVGVELLAVPQVRILLTFKPCGVRCRRFFAQIVTPVAALNSSIMPSH